MKRTVVRNVKTNPKMVKIAKMIPVMLFQWRFSIGRSTHVVLFLFDFCVPEHFVQFGDPLRAFTAPSGHSMHCQQQETVVVCRVPGGHGSRHIDFGISDV